MVLHALAGGSETAGFVGIKQVHRRDPVTAEGLERFFAAWRTAGSMLST